MMNSKRYTRAIIAALMLSVASLALAQADNDADDAQAYGYSGMMGPGMMGQGGMMGPGMMGQGGMMGPGMMGQGGMMGPGMMGQGGMMGPGMMGQGGCGRGGMMGPGMYGRGMYGQGGGMGPGMMGGYPGGGYGPGYGGGYRGTLGFGPMYNLSPEKRQKLTGIEGAFEKTYWETIGKIQSHYGELQQLYASGKPDPKAVGDVYAKIFELRRQIIEARVKAQNEAREVLGQ